MDNIVFESRSKMTSLPTFHKNGGQLVAGLTVSCEKNYITQLIDAKLISWQIATLDKDFSGYGKYAFSIAEVDINGKIEKWPFTMLYIKPKT